MKTLQDLLDQLQRQGPELLLDPRMLLGLLGLVLVVAGKRLYPLAIMSPGLAAGAMIGLELTPGQETWVRALACLGLALVLGFLLRQVERLAIAAAGAFVSVGATAAVAPVAGFAAEWPVLLVAGLVGLLLFPRVYERLLVVITPAIGALCLLHALGRPQDLLALVGLTLIGVVVQLVAWGRGGDG